MSPKRKILLPARHSTMFAVPLDIHSLLRTMAGAQWIAAYPQPLPCFCPGCPRGALCLVRSDTNEQPLTLAFRVRGFLHFQRQGYGRCRTS